MVIEAGPAATMLVLVVLQTTAECGLIKLKSVAQPDHQCRNLEMRIFGKLTRILGIFCIDHGLLLVEKSCCDHKTSRCQTLPTSKILGNNESQSYIEYLAEYGWESCDDSLLKDYLQKNQKNFWIAQGGISNLAFDRQKWLDCILCDF